MADFLFQKKEGNSHLVIVGAPLVLVALFCFGYIADHMPRRHVEASSKSAVHASQTTDLAQPGYKQQAGLSSESAASDPITTKTASEQASSAGASSSGAAPQASPSQQATATTASPQQGDGQVAPANSSPAADDSTGNSQQSSPGLIGGLLQKLF